MIQKIKVTRVYVSDKDRNNVPYSGKFGPYVKVGLQAEEYGQQWLSGFAKGLTDFPATIQVGDEIEVEIERKMSNGKEYINFHIPKEEDKTKAMVHELHSRLLIVEQGLRDIFEGKKPYPPRSPEKDEEISRAVDEVLGDDSPPF